jgi:hypothetical protein
MNRVLLDTVFELLLFGKMVAITIQCDTVSSDSDDDAAFSVVVCKQRTVLSESQYLILLSRKYQILLAARMGDGWQVEK